MKRYLLLIMLVVMISQSAVCETLAVTVPKEAAYFDDAVFIGDSVGNQLRHYILNLRKEGNEVLGDAQFLTAGAYTVYLASRNFIPKDMPALQYRGRAVTVRDGLIALNPGKVFIMLGLADEPGRDVDRDIGSYRKLINIIRDAVPDIKITAMSVTPITKSGEGGLLKQSNINLFNKHLEAFCEEEGIGYVDVASWLKNDHGFLNSEYSNDKKVHLNQHGIKLVVQALHYYAAEQMELEARLAETAGE
ncbi:MAG: hypothetical protein GXZ04_00850 [Clostridiales bacterium]|nr:hypothetical protein [Clostridiales bacterium]